MELLTSPILPLGKQGQDDEVAPLHLRAMLREDAKLFRKLGVVGPWRKDKKDALTVTKSSQRDGATWHLWRRGKGITS